MANSRQFPEFGSLQLTQMDLNGLADDEYSMVWLKQSWTSKVDDPMMGMKAGERGTAESIEVCRHNADGKIAEHWSFMSVNDMMKMMQKSMPMDTSHKASPSPAK